MNLIKEILESFQINNVVGEVNEEDLLKDTPIIPFHIYFIFISLNIKLIF